MKYETEIYGKLRNCKVHKGNSKLQKRGSVMCRYLMTIDLRSDEIFVQNHDFIAKGKYTLLLIFNFLCQSKLIISRRFL